MMKTVQVLLCYVPEYNKESVCPKIGVVLVKNTNSTIAHLKRPHCFPTIKFSQCWWPVTQMFNRFKSSSCRWFTFVPTPDCPSTPTALRYWGWWVFTRLLPLALGEGVPKPTQTVDTAQLRDGETVISGVHGDCHNINTFATDIYGAGGLNQLGGVGFTLPLVILKWKCYLCLMSSWRSERSEEVVMSANHLSSQPKGTPVWTTYFIF